MPRDSVRYSLKTGQSPHRHYHPKQNVGFFAHNSYGLAALLFVLKFAMAYNGRGSAKDDLKDYAGAIADYDKAIELDPKDASTYNNRAISKKNLKDYAGAIADYNKAIELDPQYAYAYNNRGIAKYDLKDYAGAIADYDKAIELNPKYTRAYKNLIALYEALNKPEMAEEIRRLKQKNCPDNQ